MLKRISVNNSESDNAGSNIHLPVTCLFESNKENPLQASHARSPFRHAGTPHKGHLFQQMARKFHSTFLQAYSVSPAKKNPMTLQHLQLNDGFLLFSERWSATLMWIPLTAQFQHHTDYFFPMFSKQVCMIAVQFLADRP